jgi:hypothetical protein
MRLLTFRKVSVQRETLYLTVPIDTGSSTVPVNRTPDGPFKVSKVVTVAQGFGRLSNIHGQSASFTGHEPRVKGRLILAPEPASRFSIFRRNQVDHSAGFRLDNGHLGIRIAVWNTGASAHIPDVPLQCTDNIGIALTVRECVRV